MDDICSYEKSIFESIKKINEYTAEFWHARDLQEVLKYKRWDKFLNVIEKAKEACKNSNIDIDDHFSHVGKMIELGKTAQREIEDIELSRYACYLVVQNADPRKKVRREKVQGKVKANQTHFEVGSKVRQTIKELGGTMPEELPTPRKSIQQLEMAQKKLNAGEVDE